MFNLLNPLSLLTNPGARQAGLQAFGGARDIIQTPKFKEMFQFGAIDNGLLIVMMLGGLAMDDWIAEKVGVKGYGAVMGAVIGNALSDGAAALPQGPEAAFGVTAGALMPAMPLVAAMYAKKPLTGTTHKVIMASAIGMLAWQFTRRKNAGAANV